jgi:hypothetical protein
MRWLQISDPFFGFFMDSDKDNSGGDNKEDNKDGNTSDGDGKNTGADSDDSDDSDDDVIFDEKQQAKLNKLIANAKKKASDKTKADIEAANKAEKEKIEKAELEQQGKFEGLYNTEKTAKEQLEAKASTLQEKLDKIAERQNKLINDSIKNWDKDIKALDPGPDDIEVRLSWFEKMSPIAGKLSGTKVPKTEGGNADEQDSPTASEVVNKVTSGRDWIPGKE